jgi:hypothetical protein
MSCAEGSWVLEYLTLASVESLLLFLGALLEEDFPQDILFLLVRIIVLNIIVMRLVEHTV